MATRQKKRNSNLYSLSDQMRHRDRQTDPVCVFVCVFVCVWERDTHTHSHTERDREAETNKDRYLVSRIYPMIHPFVGDDCWSKCSRRIHTRSSVLYLQNCIHPVISNNSLHIIIIVVRWTEGCSSNRRNRWWRSSWQRWTVSSKQ